MDKERTERTREQRVQKEALADFEYLAREQPPQPEKNWNLIWAFCGPHGFHQNGTWVKKGPDTIYQNISDDVNEAITRFNTAATIAKQVTGLRLGKDTDKVTLEDIRQHGPKIFFNEWDWQNDDLRQLYFQENGEEIFGFPKENLIIPENTQVMHTGHQLERFPKELLRLLDEDGKLILVSDLYHLPRIKRYAWKSLDRKIIDRLIFYPSQPLVGSFRLFRGELRKIVEYGKKGDLVWSPAKD